MQSLRALLPSEVAGVVFWSRVCVAELRNAKKLEIQIRSIRPPNVQIKTSSLAGIIIK
jgi:hypothetical protein